MAVFVIQATAFKKPVLYCTIPNGNIVGLPGTGHDTLTDSTLSCPKSSLKTTPMPQGYPRVSGGWYVTPEPRFRGMVLDHQLLEEPEPKNLSKRAKFEQKQHFLGGVLILAPLNLNG